MKRLLLATALLIPAVLPAQQVERFGDVTVCALCHLEIPPPETSEIADSSIGPSALWPGSMMAHAARDPYWKAKVRFEAAKLPALGEVIEDTCLACHAPMQQYDRRIAGKRLGLNELDSIGEQGVACTVCHQITAKNFGEKASFEAHFEINAKRENYGPHPRPFAHPMQMHSGYTPVHSDHVLESALCATCHTVITPSVDASGKVVGEFVEQAPYLEWLASDYGDMGFTCQDCHMPALEDGNGKPAEQYIAHNPMRFPFPPTYPRKPFGMHQLAGGNITVLELMKTAFPDEVEQLTQKQRQTRDLLDEALSLTLESTRADSHFNVAVTVSNNTGHKLPSGFPSRRVWLHVTARDASGKILFESGAWDPASGEIRSLDGLEPHHARIRNPSRTMIYEAEMADTDGNVTVSLLRANSYAKDNRLLPSGFDLSKPLPQGIDPASIAPAGTDADPAFEPGGHTVIYEIPSTAASVTAEALYQPIKPSHARVLAHGDSPEERTFTGLLKGRNTPIPLTSETLDL